MAKTDEQLLEFAKGNEEIQSRMPKRVKVFMRRDGFWDYYFKRFTRTEREVTLYRACPESINMMDKDDLEYGCNSHL